MQQVVIAGPVPGTQSASPSQPLTSGPARGDHARAAGPAKPTFAPVPLRRGGIIFTRESFNP